MYVIWGKAADAINVNKMHKTVDGARKTQEQSNDKRKAVRWFLEGGA